ncbi:MULTISPECIES: hypothetical protein [Paenibacillus]|uniref:Uncharacterized protein n=1 Tax=Paenibacillus lactis 154 TaxID=743719 RepID=G4HPJ1_9BACL|nr:MULTISPECIES: hypothetical protein [Paenibacillus]EHB47898.1 hypothetical protein PaelaDRAFT_5902 [Paenibacillus lactis 154]GIO94600.1 hypothetical protein J31TS3_58270 [Paenibacillus lactis]
MIKIHTMTPFHHQYQRPQPMVAPKATTNAKTATFQEILNQKMREATKGHQAKR